MNRIRILVLNGRFIVPGQIQSLPLVSEKLVYETIDPGIVINILQENAIDIVVLDIGHLNGKGTSFIRSVRSCNPDVDIVLVAPANNHPPDKACGSIQLLKGAPGREELQLAIEMTNSYKKYLTHQQQLDINFQKFSREIGCRGGQKIIGESRAVKSIASLILLVSQSDSTSVMVTGESGTGKELVARGIHMLGQNFQNPFHAVNCSAIPDSLFESEFFGYRKGAFTGAFEKSDGWFEMANNSTLFLDEVTELPLCMQSKFLRVLDDKIIHKIGSHQEIKLNLRIISATNQNLEKLMEKKMFREDLYHRLKSFHIHIPPLRERREDIPPLLDFYIEQISNKMNKPVKQVDDHAMKLLMNYEFPGNVRELRNLVEGAVILSADKKLSAKDFSIKITNKLKTDAVFTHLPASLSDIEKNAIQVALQESHNNKSEAARILAISRQSLDRRMLKLHIQ